VFNFPHSWTINSLSLLGGWLILKGLLHNEYLLDTVENNNKNISHPLLIFYQQLAASVFYEYDSAALFFPQ